MKDIYFSTQDQNLEKYFKCCVNVFLMFVLMLFVGLELFLCVASLFAAIHFKVFFMFFFQC